MENSDNASFHSMTALNEGEGKEEVVTVNEVKEMETEDDQIASQPLSSNKLTYEKSELIALRDIANDAEYDKRLDDKLPMDLKLRRMRDVQFTYPVNRDIFRDPLSLKLELLRQKKQNRTSTTSDLAESNNDGHESNASKVKKKLPYPTLDGPATLMNVTLNDERQLKQNPSCEGAVSCLPGLAPLTICSSIEFETDAMHDTIAPRANSRFVAYQSAKTARQSFMDRNITGRTFNEASPNANFSGSSTSIRSSATSINADTSEIDTLRENLKQKTQDLQEKLKRLTGSKQKK